MGLCCMQRSVQGALRYQADRNRQEKEPRFYVLIFDHLSVRWKIYYIAIISIIGFGGYLGFNVLVNTRNADLLSNLSAVYFPVLEKSKSNRVKLDRLSELLSSAVQTGELDYIAEAEKLADAMVVNFDKVAQLEPARAAEMRKISDVFTTYFVQAKTIASEMASGQADMSTLAEKAEKKEAANTLLLGLLDESIRQSEATFSSNIAKANKNSQHLLTSGFVIWGINILILTVAVYTIARIILRNINRVSHSLSQIASGGGDYTKRIEVSSKDEIGRLATSFNGLMDNLQEKTNDLMSMMQNMHQGLFTITDQEVIHQEYSSYIETIFNTKNIAGTHYATLLFAGAKIGSDTQDQVRAAISGLLGADEMMFEFNQHLLIKDYVVQLTPDEPEKILELDWDPIIADGCIDKIMVTLRDVTELRLMQARAKAQQKELEIVGQILKASPDKFAQFVQNTERLLALNESMIRAAQGKSAKLVGDLFVNMHTIKGNARTYSFAYITDPVHEAENAYDILRKDADAPWKPEALLADIAAVREALAIYVQVRDDKLNFSTAAPEGLVLSHDESALLAQHLVASAQNNPQLAALAERLQATRAVSLAQVLSPVVQSLPSLAQQVGKPVPSVAWPQAPLLIQPKLADVFNDVFMHLFRNALDHGIESAQERSQQGKPGAGEIVLQFDPAARRLIMRDDGRGLNLRRLREKALEAGVLTQAQADSAQAVAQCLFESGVSTAQQLTDISGRGVGMDAVRHYLQQRGCNIQLQLDAHVAASDDFGSFQWEITLAPEVLAA
jgi:two-component system, chemotaxis family, sensor kinase CheA